MAYFASAGNSSLAGLGRNGPLRIRYNVTITNITRPQGFDISNSSSSALQRYLLTSSTGQAFTCKYLILSTGLQQAVEMPSAAGRAAVASGLIKTYANAPTDSEAYRGKRVLLLGHGNAAWEFAHHTLDKAAYVHVVGRPTSRLKLALETHYPGNVRAVHGTLLETYNLKSLDGITAAPFERLAFAATSQGGVNVTVIGASGTSSCTRDSLGRPTSRCAFRHPYDVVVACLGWKMDLSIFPHKDTRPLLMPKTGKHPVATPRFEAPGLPGLFFAGTLTHAADFKKASGGFIHGFRYSARALHRFLEEQEQEEEEEEERKMEVEEERCVVDATRREEARISPSTTTGGRALVGLTPLPWPSTPVSTLRGLVALILRRLNGASGLYQMFGALCDVYVFHTLPLPSRKIDIFPGPHAAMYYPWDYYDPEGAPHNNKNNNNNNNNKSSDTGSGLAADIASMQQQRTRAHSAKGLLSHRRLLFSARSRETEAAVNAALSGALREEVPVGAAWAKARYWGSKGVLSSPDSSRNGSIPSPAAAAVDWLQITLEFGPSAPAGSKDPFALNRADVGLRDPERSHFLHPVLRYFHAGSSSSACLGGPTTHSNCPPLSELHLIEDSHAEWGLHTAHVLPLARWLQHLGTMRVGGGNGGIWAPPRPPPLFLGGLLTQFMSVCDGGSTLWWAGSAFPAEGEPDGWWMKLSISAEASLEGLRVLAIHALDPSAPTPLSPYEREYTEGVRAAWAAAAAASSGGDDGGGSRGEEEEVLLGEWKTTPIAPPLADALEEAYGVLTERTQGLGVLSLNARAGGCRLLAEKNGVRVGDVRVFVLDRKGGWEDPAAGELIKGFGVSVDAERAVTPGEGARHIRAISKQHLKGAAGA